MTESVSLSTLSSLVDAASEALLIVDGTGKIVRANATAERVFGYEPGTLAEQDVDSLVPDELREGHAAQRAAYLRAPTPRSMGRRSRLRGRRRDGSSFPARVGLCHARQGDEDFVLAIVIDTSELMRAERRLQRQAELLQRSNRELEQFASVASHDLQEPLRKIQAFGARLADRCAGALDDRGRDYLRRMQSAAHRMSTLVNDLLTFSRLAGADGAAFVSVDLNEVLEGVLSDLELRIEEVGGLVEVDDLPTLEAEPLQMRRLFQNLLENALKFRRPEAAPRVRIGASRSHDRVSITVEDNGVGFEERHRERIFAVFKRLHARSAFPGTGIGLAVCRQIVERHRGSIEAHGSLGEGARFEIVLPLHQEDADA